MKEIKVILFTKVNEKDSTHKQEWTIHPNK
jgi:hypothetical protein